MSLTRTSLRIQIRDILLERMLNGHYKPGDRLIELQIAQEFGTSQAPVRESLRELEALGFVTAEPYRGARVRAANKDELIEIYPVRAALEEVAVCAAAKRLAGNGEMRVWIEALEAEQAAMEREAEKGNLLQEVRHDVAFHRLIVEASGNGVLLNVWKSLHIEARTLISVISIGIEPATLAALHRPILDALTEGNGELAGKLIREHVEYFGILMLKSEHPL